YREKRPEKGRRSPDLSSLLACQRRWLGVRAAGAAGDCYRMAFAGRYCSAARLRAGILPDGHVGYRRASRRRTGLPNPRWPFPVSAFVIALEINKLQETTAP